MNREGFILMLKKSLFSVAALILGFIVGIIISEILAIVGLAIIGPTSWLAGLKFVPFIVAGFSVAAVWIWLPVKKRA
jgi:multisubunit Na+/H+ antiporter MnhE subunit